MSIRFMYFTGVTILVSAIVVSPTGNLVDALSLVGISFILYAIVRALQF